MAFTGTIADTETARRASMCILLADSLNLINDADLTSADAAKAAVDAAEALLPITDRLYAVHVKRAIDVAIATTGNSSLFSGSSLATVYAALPDNNGKHARMIS